MALARAFATPLLLLSLLSVGAAAVLPPKLPRPASTPAENITATDPRVVWIGRVVANATRGTVAADWESVEARLQVNNGSQLLTATIDGGDYGGQRIGVYVVSTATGYLPVRVSSFWTSSGVATYTVLSGYSLQYDCEVRLMRTVEPLEANAWAGSNSVFLGFFSDAGFAAAPARKPRRIEFHGDSITAGLGNLGTFSSGCWASPFTEDYGYSYVNLICQAFDAECSTLAWTGISLAARSTGPSLPGCPQGQCVLPDLFPYSLPTFAGNADYLWDYSSFVPSAVHINLGTNDQHGNFSNTTFEALFVEDYIAYVEKISAAYADQQAKQIAYFLGFGPMSFAYQPAVLTVLANLTAQGYRAVPVNYTVANYDPIGCEYHPSVEVDRAMAQLAVPVIAKEMGWSSVW